MEYKLVITYLDVNQSVVPFKHRSLSLSELLHKIEAGIRSELRDNQLYIQSFSVDINDLSFNSESHHSNIQNFLSLIKQLEDSLSTQLQEGDYSLLQDYFQKWSSITNHDTLST